MRTSSLLYVCNVLLHGIERIMTLTGRGRARDGGEAEGPPATRAVPEQARREERRLERRRRHQARHARAQDLGRQGRAPSARRRRRAKISLIRNEFEYSNREGRRNIGHRSSRMITVYQKA